MKREHVDIVLDTHWGSHAVTRIGGEVVSEVIEIRTGEWNSEAMNYLTTEGDRLKEEGFRYGTLPSLAEAWTRYEFRRSN